jgi:hypothetical protein
MVSLRVRRVKSFGSRRVLKGGSRTVQGVVDLVHNVWGTDSAEVEVAAVETLKGLLATADWVELDEDLSIGVGIDSNVNDLAVLLVALHLDFVLKILRPVGTIFFEFPVQMLAPYVDDSWWDHLLVGIESVLDLDALGRRNLVLDGDTSFGHRAVVLLGRNINLVASKVHHKLVAVNLLEVDTRHISIIKRRGTADATVISTMSSVEDPAGATGLSAATTSTTECGALVARRLLREVAEEMGGRLGCELVISKTNADLAAGKLEAVHLGERLLGVIRINESKGMLAITLRA